MSVSSMPAWYIKRIPGQSGLLLRETLSQKAKINKEKKSCRIPDGVQGV